MSHARIYIFANMKKRIIFFCFICLICHNVLSQFNDSLIAGLTNTLRVALPKEQSYPKYTLQLISAGKMTEVKETFDSLDGQKILTASVIPACDCMSLVVAIMGIKKNDNMEKIGTVELPVRKVIPIYPRWRISYTPQNETVSRTDTFPVNKNTVITAPGSRYFLYLEIPDYQTTRGSPSSLSYRVRVYKKTGMSDYQPVGNIKSSASNNWNSGGAPLYYIIPAPFNFLFTGGTMSYVMYEIELELPGGKGITIPCDTEKDPKKRASYSATLYRFTVGSVPNSKPAKSGIKP
ncbi:MAG: hypothetical protein NZ455_15060 [Bacteroidia bacterium]|nr:hypothetical protein [Bacteroidia bacterium]MDW8347717.1 hypothetical protein [Bacteroidia bacterium]